jgi:hypothetical protein
MKTTPLTKNNFTGSRDWNFSKNLLPGKMICMLGLTVLSNGILFAQHNLSTNQISGQSNGAAPALPFLMVSPDARAGGMGDAGVAFSPDANSIYWNASKLAFIDSRMGLGVSYTPWLRALVPDINLFCASFYLKWNENQAVSASVRYFSLGDISLYNVPLGASSTLRHKEVSYDLAYSRKLEKHFSIGMTGRCVYSDATNQGKVYTGAVQPVNAYSADVSAFYHNEQIKLGSKQCALNAGLNFSNIGPTVHYTDSTGGNFLPMNLRFGGAFMCDLDLHHSISFIADVNKLLVRPQPSLNACGGLEYGYRHHLAVRGGYFCDFTEGDHRYFTLGTGINSRYFAFDFSYLIPTEQRNPLQNSLRINIVLKLT